jgi:glycosyltransferase involved in cell wall biosynthesis
MTIFYICPWAEKPTGGIKQIFRHVEALSAAGFDAHALVLDRTVPSWFGSAAPVATVTPPRAGWIPRRSDWKKNRIDWLASTKAPWVELAGPAKARVKRKRQLGANDILVLPEYPGKTLRPCGFGSKLVVFNQNAHYTFAGFSYADEPNGFVYQHLLAALAVSNHTFEYLRFAFPGLRVLLTPNGVDAERFFPDELSKKRQIAFMPRKLPGSIVQVLQMLRSRGSLDGWQLCPIDGMDEAAVATSLRQSAIFLSTCHDEGFGLPPLEAAASGCVVVGYTGQAAQEFMLPEYCYPVAQGDVLGFAQTLENVMAEFDANPQRLLQQAARYAEFTCSNYSKQQEGQRVVEAWNEICGDGAQRR